MIYIALLRGINVGGHTVKMEHLRQLFTEQGFTHVRTYIQSGNVFFESDETDRARLTSSIEEHLRQVLGYEVPVMLRTLPELEQIVASDPFKALTVTPDMRLCIVFTSQRIPNSLTFPVRSPKGDMEVIAATGTEAFVVWHIINGRPPASESFLSALLGKKTTTRFFHTTAKMLAAANQ